MKPEDMGLTAGFYDGLAPHYHLLYADWESSVARQGESLAALLRECGVEDGAPVLDAACGIGTQTLGLLQQGFEVRASDLSAGAVQRLRAELDRRGLRAEATIDDLRTLAHAPDGRMAAVLACDNSVPHLLSDGEIVQAFLACRRVLRPGGVAVLSVRDYAVIPRVNPDVRPHALQRVGDDRFVSVQVWEWDGDQYDLRLYLTHESADGRCETQVLRSRYYAITIDRLMALLRDAGFTDVTRHDDVMFQPVLVARKPR
jgi:SAM-dependent methyltransferase